MGQTELAQEYLGRLEQDLDSIKQLEIEREAIKRENDKPKLEIIGKELAELICKVKAKKKWRFDFYIGNQKL